MAIIYSYQENEDLLNSDMLVGTATTLHNGKVRKITKNFTLGQLKTFINTGDLILSNGGTSGPATLIDNVLNIPVYQGQITLTTTGSSGASTLIGNTLNIPQYGGLTTVPTLDEVLTAGNVSEINAYFGGEVGLYDTANLGYCTINAFDSSFTFSNSLGDPVLYFEQGTLAISKSSTIAGSIYATSLSASRNYNLPDASGTIALTSDIPSLTGYVQTTRTLTINGTTYDLSANRTWSVGTVTDVTATGLITSTGGTNPVISTLMHTDRLIGRTTAGSGTMEEITVGSGLTLSAGTLSATASGSYVPYTGATGNVDLGIYGLLSDKLSLNTSPTQTLTAAGQMIWNDTDGTLDIRLKGNNVTLQVGQESIVRVVNKTGSNLLESNYQVVRVRTESEGGSAGQRLAVKLAQADTKVNHTGILGLVTEDINNNQEGFITSYGFVNKINTTGSIQGETWIDGDSLWLSASVAGGLTNIEPTEHPVQIGYVTYSHVNNGKIFVRFGESADELDELHDVYINPATLANGDLLQYNSATDLWLNKSLSAAGIQPTLPSLSSGSVIFSNGTTLAQDNSNFFWNDSNKRLGIGTTTPYASLTIQDSTSNQIVLKGTSGIDGISSFSGGSLVSFDATLGPYFQYQYNALTMIPALGFITYAGFEVLTGNITTGYIPRKAPIGVENSLIYDNGTNVGIGTTSPSGKLHVNGNMYLQNAATGVESITFSSGPLIRNDGPSGIFKSGEVYTDTINGRVGIVTSTPTTALDVNGVITATGGNSTSWNAKQDAITLTTTGTSGPATLVGATLNIPEYGSGGGGNILATHILAKPQSGFYYGTGIGVGTTVSSTTNGVLILSAFTPAYELTVSSIVLYVTTALAGGLLKVVIYSDLNGVPNTKLFESPTAAADTIGSKTITGFSFTFSAGTTYWVSMIANGTIGVRCLNAASITAAPIIANSNSTQFYQSWFINNSFATPSVTLTTPTSGNLNGGAIPYVIFRAT